MTGHDADLLRSMVREVLREVLPVAAASGRESAEQSGGPGRGRSDSSASSPTPPAVRRVRIRDDHDLDALVGQVLDLAEDPERRADLRAGRLRFVLESTDPAAATGPSPAAPAPLDVERGAVTERLVHRAAREQRPLRIGPRAVVTPLARDRARALGVTIERTSVSSDQRREPR